jgi:GntR family transcriptional regulator
MDELGERYGVSKQAAAMAVAILRREGIVETRGAKGTYVAARPPRRRLPLHRFSRARAGRTRTLEGVTWDIQTPGRIVPPPPVAAIFDLPEDAKMVRRTHVAYDEDTGEPVEAGGQWLRVEDVGGSEVETSPHPIEGGMYALVERLTGRRYTWATDRYTVGFPTPEEAAALRIRQDTPVLRVSTIHTDADDRPIELAHATWPGHSVAVELRYRIDEAQPPPDAGEVSSL